MPSRKVLRSRLEVWPAGGAGWVEAGGQGIGDACGTGVFWCAMGRECEKISSRHQSSQTSGSSIWRHAAEIHVRAERHFTEPSKEMPKAKCGWPVKTTKFRCGCNEIKFGKRTTYPSRDGCHPYSVIPMAALLPSTGLLGLNTQHTESPEKSPKGSSSGSIVTVALPRGM